MVNRISEQVHLDEYVQFQVEILQALQNSGAPTILFERIMQIIERHLPVERHLLFLSKKSLTDHLWKFINGPTIQKTNIKFESDFSTGHVYSFDAFEAIKLLLQHPHFQDVDKLLVKNSECPFEPYQPNEKYIQHMLDGDVWKRAVMIHSSADTFLFPICFYSDSAQVTKNGNVSVTPMVIWSPMIWSEH